ncbi:Tripartite motif-containing protein 10 [Varanus komodoensis]|nr:Tripartite motif-containing protein 10 [Varanus komodoensis]
MQRPSHSHGTDLRSGRRRMNEGRTRTWSGTSQGSGNRRTNGSAGSLNRTRGQDTQDGRNQMQLGSGKMQALSRKPCTAEATRRGRTHGRSRASVRQEAGTAAERQACVAEATWRDAGTAGRDAGTAANGRLVQQRQHGKKGKTREQDKPGKGEADMAAGGLSQGPCEEKLCSVCNGYRADPVILDCGHRFCQACLAKGSCLQCGETSQECNLQSDQELAQNIGQEQHVAEESKESKLQEVSSTMAVATVIMDLIQDIICPICQELPTDLVTLACDHTFCRCCINGLYETHEKLCEEMGKLKCPVCKAKIQKGDHRPNWMLANIVQKIKRNKSILVTRALCKKHNENLHLFCKDDAELLCVFCEHSPEHKGHSVHLQEEAAQEYKKTIQDQLLLQKESAKVMIQKLEEQKTVKCLIQLGVEKQKVKSIFEQMHDFLNEKEGHCLTELCDLEKEMEMEQEESVTQLSREIAKLNDLISEMEAKLGQPPDEFLQDIKSTLSRSGRKPEHVEDVFPKLEERLCIYSQKTSAVKEIMEECKESLERELSKGNYFQENKINEKSLMENENTAGVHHSHT